MTHKILNVFSYFKMMNNIQSLPIKKRIVYFLFQKKEEISNVPKKNYGSMTTIEKKLTLETLIQNIKIKNTEIINNVFEKRKTKITPIFDPYAQHCNDVKRTKYSKNSSYYDHKYLGPNSRKKRKDTKIVNLSSRYYPYLSNKSKKKRMNKLCKKIRERRR
jgi:hypothetical protein